MEPTPELKSLAEGIAQLLCDQAGVTSVYLPAFEQILVDRAKELREALLPFERAAELSPAKRAAVENGKRLVESRRLADERAAQQIGADKPAYVPKRSAWEVVVGWLPWGRK